MMKPAPILGLKGVVKGKTKEFYTLEKATNPSKQADSNKVIGKTF